VNGAGESGKLFGHCEGDLTSRFFLEVLFLEAYDNFLKSCTMIAS
jgi:hypothetical protein